MKKIGSTEANGCRMDGAQDAKKEILDQYFSNKNDVVWAIVGDLLTESTDRVKKAVETADTALGKITALLDVMAEWLTNDRSKVRSMAQFDAMYARHWPADRLLSLEAQVSPQAFQHFGVLIREGIADGSLRPDLDPELTLQAVVNAIIGAQRRLASLGERVELEYGRPIDRLFRETIRVILLGLRASETPLATRSPKRPQRNNRRRPS